MTKRLVPGRNFNIDVYWDTVDVDTGRAVGDVSESIVIPKFSMVKRVFAMLQRQAQGGGATVFVVGDSETPDGYILSQSMKRPVKVAGGAPVTTAFWGLDPDELGAYLSQRAIPLDAAHTDFEDELITDQPYGRFFRDGTTIIAKTTVSTSALDLSGVVRVWVEILTFLTEEVAGLP